MRIPRRAHLITASLTAVVLSTAGATAAFASAGGTAAHAGARGGTTATPIKHVVVIYDENVSFDHYFGTYPKAAGTDGTPFTAARFGPSTPGALELVSGQTHGVVSVDPASGTEHPKQTA